MTIDTGDVFLLRCCGFYPITHNTWAHLNTQGTHIVALATNFGSPAVKYLHYYKAPDGMAGALSADTVADVLKQFRDLASTVQWDAAFNPATIANYPDISEVPSEEDQVPS